MNSDQTMQAINAQTDLVLFCCVFVIGFTFSLLPSIIAFRRQHLSRFPILLVNVFFGWTVIGWFICLFWALSRPERAVCD